MSLEDDFCDIIKKARVGQGLSVEELARRTELPATAIAAWERGSPPSQRQDVRALAAGLGLRPVPLEQIVIDQWTPRTRRHPDWVETVFGSIGGYGVQGYVLHDEGEAVVVDTAYNAPAMIEFLAARGLRLLAVCLTHGHADHAEGIDRLLRHREVPVYLGPEDVALLDWKPRIDLLAGPNDGRTIRVGRLNVQCMETPGHTPGGICYRVDDAQHPVCFVGDTLFAGSIGRSNPAALYRAHLDSVGQRVLALSPGYHLLPGHGPATTVEEEQAHNPFYSVG